MEKEQIKNLIQLRFPGVYNDYKMDLMIKDIENSNSEIKRRIFKFLEAGEIEDIEIEGYTVKKLTEMGINTLASFLCQDWLTREPEVAKQALSGGFDTIKFEKN
ncbi:MAG: hypothetical protein WCK48_00855 [bacterium]